MNRRMIAAALACLACTAGLSACGGSASAENVYRIAVIIKHTDEHFQKVFVRKSYPSFLLLCGSGSVRLLENNLIVLHKA